VKGHSELLACFISFVRHKRHAVFKNEFRDGGAPPARCHRGQRLNDRLYGGVETTMQRPSVNASAPSLPDSAAFAGGERTSGRSAQNTLITCSWAAPQRVPVYLSYQRL